MTHWYITICIVYQPHEGARVSGVTGRHLASGSGDKTLFHGYDSDEIHEAEKKRPKIYDSEEHSLILLWCHWLHQFWLSTLNLESRVFNSKGSNKNFLHQYLINLVQTFELDHMPIKQLLEVNLFIIHFKTTKFCLIGLQFCASIYKFAKSCCSEKILQQKNWSHFSYLKAVDQSY